MFGKEVVFNFISDISAITLYIDNEVIKQPCAFHSMDTRNSFTGDKVARL
jgi:hypothetical protein